MSRSAHGRAGFRRHRLGIASAAVVVLAASALVTYAISSEGYPVHHARLNDASVWVTMDQPSAAFGLMNRPVGQFDAVLHPPRGTSNVDVLQDGAAVAGMNTANDTLTPIDASDDVLDKADAVQLGGSDVAMAGGTLAALDPSSGRLWATGYDPQQTLGDLSALDSQAGAKPAARVGAHANMTVGTDGTIYAVSLAAGLTTLRPSGRGFVTTRTSLGRLNLGGDTLTITAVGSTPVVLATAPGSSTAKLIFPGGRAPVSVPDAAGAVLQQSGPAESELLLATDQRLDSVSLPDGSVTGLSPEVGSGAPAAPLEFRDCVFAAWAGSAPESFTDCAGQTPTYSLPHTSAVASLVYRTNRDEVLLNDTTNGGVWTVDAGRPQEIDDWSKVRPPAHHTSTSHKVNPNLVNDKTAKPPKAVSDTLGARAGRTNTLYVLDNDSNPAGGVLSVKSVSGLNSQQATVSVAPDGQSVLLYPDSGFTGTLSFQYDDTNGAHPSNQATVKVKIEPDGSYVAPRTRYGYHRRTWSVPVNGVVTIPVLPDWRDYGDADPPVLAADPTVGKDGSAAITTSDGDIVFSAPAEAGTETVGYSVEDGSQHVTRSLTVDVESASTGKAVAAVANSDYARGTVKHPFTVDPLSNDQPGSDPLHPDASLAIAGAVKSVPGLQITGQAPDGTLTLDATRRKSYTLHYQASYGSAPLSATATIRVDVTAAQTGATIEAEPDAVTVHGSAPSMVDVLDNDYDPAGDLLDVVGISAPTGLQAAVVQGEWVRVNADSTTPVTTPTEQVVRYSVTDGVGAPVTGEVIVTELPALASDPPVTEPDYATVRSGDEVTIPVLDNDVDEGGDPISLDQNVTGAPPGQLPVSATGRANFALGNAYVSGDLVRYVAPKLSAGAAQQQVEVDYTANTGSAGGTAVGRAYVTITPPGTEMTDQAPQPQNLTARVVAGGIVVIPVPTSGVDPDGDTVAVEGLGVPSGSSAATMSPAPKLGALIKYTANSLTYEAFPAAGNGGTDQLSYSVTDRYGQTGTATVRIAVVPPTSLPGAVAHVIRLTAAPGSTVRVDVVTPTNVDYPAGTTPTLMLPTAKQYRGVVSADSSPGWVDVKVPTATGDGGFQVPYSVRGADGTLSPSTIDITPRTGYITPPTAVDQFAKAQAGKTELSVNLLKGDSSPTGGTLRVISPASAPNGTLVVPLRASPQVIPYEIEDSNHGVAAALVYVPAGAIGGAPYWNGRPLSIKAGAITTVDLSHYVTDPGGGAVRLTYSGQQWAAPAGDLAASIGSATELKLASSHGYQGPGAATFVVTDGATLTTPGARTATITIPVQVGSPTPVLRCSTTPVQVMAGRQKGTPLSSLCHVWTPTGIAAASLRYHLAWNKTAADVTLPDNDTPQPSVLAGRNAKPGETGVFKVSIDNYPAAPSSSLNVQVIAAPLLTVAPIPVTGVHTGSTKTIDIADETDSPFGPAAVSVVSFSAPSGMTVTHAGAGSITVAPHTGLHGIVPISLIVTDISDHNDQSRLVHATLEVQVLDRPDAPTALAVRPGYFSKVATLTWVASAANGSPITDYQVQYHSANGGSTSFDCHLQTTCNVTNLTNGVHYTFRVRARNAVNWSDFTPPQSGTPDIAPEAVTGLRFSDPQKGSLMVSWTPSAGPSSNVGFYYVVSWTGADRGSSPELHGRNQHSYTATGLAPVGSPDADNVPETFTVTAYNEAGPSLSSPTATGVGQSAGIPATPTVNPIAPESSAEQNSDKVTAVITWAKEAPEGADGWNGASTSATYAVLRSAGAGGSFAVLPECERVPASSPTCTDQVPDNNGITYSYEVTATNNAGKTSTPSGARSFSDIGDPATPTVTKVSAPSDDQKLQVDFTLGPVRGSRYTKAVYKLSNGDSGTWTATSAWTTTASISEDTGSEPTDSALSVESLTVYNESADNTISNASAPASSNGLSAQPFGAIPQPSVNFSQPVGTTVNWSVTVQSNGRPVSVSITHHGSTDGSQTVSGSNQTFTGSDDVGYSSTDSVTVTVSDASDNGRPSSTNSGTSGETEAPPAPPPPTISSFVAVPGGSSGSGTSGRVGVAWTTTYPSGSENQGGECNWTRDGSSFTGTDPGNDAVGPLPCADNGRASRQFMDQPSGTHQYCGWIQMPDGEKSNVLCESITVPS